MKRDQTVHLGYAIGSGESVEIPLAHTFVTGQTRLSGKTTALRAIVIRSGSRAIAFVTKRGEDFEGRRIRPYLPREGDRPIHWRLVETIVASAMGMKHMARERWFILNAAKGAKSLQAVRDNVARLQAKAKGATAEQYEMVGEYLDLVLPEMRELNAAQQLDLQPGLNVIDVSGHSAQLQAMVIRASMEHINRNEEGVLTVFPEAWEFAPRGRKTPASDEAVAMARKGGVLGNWLLCDSQDIAGVDTTIRQAASVWILGVQRELNELKRTLAMIPPGIKKPKAADITSLKLGEFVVCWGDNAIRTYVQPTWMSESEARQIATGIRSLSTLPVLPEPEIRSEPSAPLPDEGEDDYEQSIGRLIAKQEDRSDRASTTESEDDMSAKDVQELKESIAALTQLVTKPSFAAVAAAQQVSKVTAPPPPGSEDFEEAMYQRFKSRLATEAPALLKLLINVPELEVTVERKTVTADESSTLGMIAICYKDDFFKEGKTSTEVWKEIQRRWSFQGIAARAFEQLEKLTSMGFLTKEEQENKKATKYVAVPGMKVNIVKK